MAPGDDDDDIIIIIESQRFHFKLGWLDHNYKQDDDPRRFSLAPASTSIQDLTSLCFEDFHCHDAGEGSDHFDDAAKTASTTTTTTTTITTAARRWAVWQPQSASRKKKHVEDNGGGWLYNQAHRGNERKWVTSRREHTYVRRRFWVSAVETAPFYSLRRESSFSGMEKDSRTMRHTALRCGWMSMRKGLSKQLHKRFFVLYPQVLCYYEDEPPSFDIEQHEPQGTIPLTGAVVIRHLRKAAPDVPASPKISFNDSNPEDFESMTFVPLELDAPSSDEQTFAIDSPVSEQSMLLRCEVRRENHPDFATATASEVEAVASSRAWMEALQLTINKQFSSVVRVGEVRTRVDTRMVSGMPEYATAHDGAAGDGGVKACRLCVLS